MTHTLFPDPVVPAISRCGIARRSAHTDSPETSWPRQSARGELCFVYASDSSKSRSATCELSAFGTSMPIYPLPGTGASMRIEAAANANAKSSASVDILLTFTFVRLPLLLVTKSGSTPNWVIVGPRLISTTLPGAPNETRVSSIVSARCLSYSSSAVISAPTDKILSSFGKSQLVVLTSSSVVLVSRS